MPTLPDDHALTSHFEFARRLATSLVGACDADDLVQDAYVAALERPPRDPRASRGFLRSIVRRTAGHVRRAANRREEREQAVARTDSAPATDELAAAMELHRVVVQEVLQLAPDHREVVLLRFVEDLPIRTVATRLEVPVETARTRLKRAIYQLRGRLDQHDEEWRRALTPLADRGQPRRPFLGYLGAAAAVALLLGLGAWQIGTADQSPNAVDGPRPFRLYVELDYEPVYFSQAVPLQVRAANGDVQTRMLSGTSPFGFHLDPGQYSLTIDAPDEYLPSEPVTIEVAASGDAHARILLRRG